MKAFFIDGIRCPVVQGRMKSNSVVKVHISLDSSAELRQGLVLLDQKVFVLQGPPEPFHFGVVTAPAASVHADGDSELLQLVRELAAGELASLIRIEYLRDSVFAHRELERFDAVERVHRVHDVVRHVLAAVQVHDGNHEGPMPGHRQIVMLPTLHLTLS